MSLLDPGISHEGEHGCGHKRARRGGAPLHVPAEHIYFFPGLFTLYFFYLQFIEGDRSFDCGSIHAGSPYQSFCSKKKYFFTDFNTTQFIQSITTLLVYNNSIFSFSTGLLHEERCVWCLRGFHHFT